MSRDSERAILAGGCYWIMQRLLGECHGVISTRAGWTGGESENPTITNHGGHAEAVEVTFDPERVSYRELIQYFLMIHRADLGQDVVGSIYRSEIFCMSQEQCMVAEETLREFDASRHWPGRIATRISGARRFWEEAPQEQHYLRRFGAGCAALAS